MKVYWFNSVPPHQMNILFKKIGTFRLMLYLKVRKTQFQNIYKKKKKENLLKVIKLVKKKIRI